MDTNCFATGYFWVNFVLNLFNPLQRLYYPLQRLEPNAFISLV
jgi:hypothetical protein